MTDYSQILKKSLERLHATRLYREGIISATALIEGQPDFYPAYVLRGVAHVTLGQHDAAIPDFRKALELKPGEPTSTFGLGGCLYVKGEADAAVPYLAEGYNATPDVATGTLLIRAAFSARVLDLELVKRVYRSAQTKFFSRHPSHDLLLSPYRAMSEWCAAHGIAPTEYDPGGEIEPTSASAYPVQAYQAPPLRFFTIPGAVAVAGLDWIIGSTGEVLDYGDLTLNAGGDMPISYEFLVPYFPDPPRKRVLHAHPREVTEVDADAVFLSAPPQHHFGDWLIEYLPRLAAWRRSGEIGNKIFTTNSLPQHHRDVLAKFGVQRGDLIVGEVGKAYRFRSLTLPDAVTSTTPVPAMATFLYRALAAKRTPLPRGSGGGRYFLERSHNTRGRNIVNAQEMSRVLEAFGFQTIRRAEMTVAEQDALFSEAGIIITPFGTDVLTFFQLRPGTDLVILQFEDMHAAYGDVGNNMYRYCAILNMRAHPLACGSVAREGFRAHKADLIVDCEALRLMLERIVHERAG